MKKIAWILFLLLAACGGPGKDYKKADDALDAGREYLNACKEGDFSRAAFYIVQDETGKRALQDLEKKYREKDKEGRQQLRTASINIGEVKEQNDSSSEIHYNYSFEQAPNVLQVVKHNGDWLVDLGKK